MSDMIIIYEKDWLVACSQVRAMVVDRG
jgi:hypothetical protein